MRLIVTRDKNQLELLSGIAAAQQVEIVALPLVKTHPIPFDWPAELRLDNLDWLFFSSSYGVKSFFSRLDDLSIKLPNRVRVAAIGNKTAEQVGKYASPPEFIPDTSTGESLFHEFLNKVACGTETIAYARAATVSFDPNSILQPSKIVYFSIICYETIECPVVGFDRDSFDENDSILFTSPSAVSSYHKKFGSPKAKTIAIGNTTLATMNNMGWPCAKVMDKPDLERALEYL